jgi:hypothetical protein
MAYVVVWARFGSSLGFSNGGPDWARLGLKTQKIKDLACVKIPQNFLDMAGGFF